MGLLGYHARLRDLRERAREELTLAERVLVWSIFWSTSVGLLLVIAGLVLLLVGGLRAVGVTLLLVGLIAQAIPSAPLLKAWGRRREAGRGPTRS